jgi:hypothetical protein
VLVANDWMLKPLAPGAITGKLSDLAGLAFAPLALSAAIGLLLAAAARLGARVDPSLSRGRLLACVLATAAVFAAVKLDRGAAHALAAVLAVSGRHAQVVADPSDLWCLPALAIAVWAGLDELRRVPLGRPAAIHRLRRPASLELADVAWAGAPADRVTALADAIHRWNVAEIDDWLAHASGART